MIKNSVKMIKKELFLGCFVQKTALFLVFFLSFSIKTTQQIITNSYKELKEICLKYPNAIIIIDLLDVGIEYKNEYLHIENKKKLMKELNRKFDAKYKQKEYIKELEKEGFHEIISYLEIYKELDDKGYIIFCITDKYNYIPSYEYSEIDTKYDSYKNGVLFYKNNFFESIIKEISSQNGQIIYITANKNRVKKVVSMKVENEVISILFNTPRKESCR